MQKNKNKARQLRDELARCLILKDEDRKFWIDNADSLPDEVIDQLLRLVNAKNLEIQDYITKAINDNPALLTDLKSKMAQIKKDTLHLAEKEQTPDAEQMLEKEIKNIK